MMQGRGRRIAWVMMGALMLSASGCSRQQSDWEKTRSANHIESYQQFIKKYPTGEFTGQAQARMKELEEERDWQKARDTDTAEAYQAFLKQYPEGKWAEEARIRVENFSLAQAPSGAAASAVMASAPTPDVATKVLPPVAARPAAPPKPAQKAPKSVVKAAKSSAADTYVVQLGAFRAGAGAAEHQWSTLQLHDAELLKNRVHQVMPDQDGKGTLYRLQVTGLNAKDAHGICARLKAKSQPCFVVPPGKG